MESTSWALEGIRRSLRLCSQGVRSFAVADYRNAGFSKDDGASIVDAKGTDSELALACAIVASMGGLSTPSISKQHER